MRSENLEDRRFPEGAWRLKNHKAGMATPPHVFSNSCLLSSLNSFIIISNLLDFEK
ncbi:hypothetical protein SGO_0117 [Streptococcus gordonii str. Challis substr. CH1]|uniref:Uncharacterized protein n=1 Tax=Streptococcus gordonii (strain Challis / ATCC 35105 / BCRC 15272 / CH1 / DL1 / V288) TaxID=467705 RepID=A8AUH9_STRGC|nr:hypothetical protein SGO_0117 [Streptococcus gordonii str. Challis substr. CH1]